MNYRKFILLAFTYLLLVSLQANDLKKLFRFLNKQELDKVVEVLVEGLEEDGNNPAYLWVTARLHAADTLNFFDIDSAYLLINKALVSFDSADQEFIQDFQEYGYGRDDLVETSEHIRELHWQRVRAILSIEAIKEFRERYPESPQNNKAIYLRDSLAFEQVGQIDNWHAYATYIRLYPKSSFYLKAKERYELLLFEDKTKSGSYQDYVEFIEKFPSSPYIENAIENVLSYQLAWNNADTLVNFVARHKGSIHVPKALDYLYHLDGREIRDPSLFLQHNRLDSLQKVHDLNLRQIYPYPGEGGVVVFAPEDKSNVILDYYSLLGESVFCDLYPFDFFVGNYEDSRQAYLVNRNGGLFYEEAVLSYKDVGLGIIWIETQAGGQLIHKVGGLVADDIEDASLIDNKWLKVKKNGKWSLMAINGFLYSPFLFDDISIVGKFWIFERDGLYAFTNSERLYKEVGKGSFTLLFKYDDYELVNDDLMIGFKGDMEGLIDSQLNFIIPWGKQTIFPNPIVPYAKRNSQYYLYGDTYVSLTGRGFNDILLNKRWIALKEDQWQAAPINTLDFEYHIDSVRLVGDEVVFIQKGDSSSLRFTNNELKMSEEDQVLILSSPAPNKESGVIEKYLQLSNRDVTTLITVDADTLFSGEYVDLKALGDSLFSAKQKGETGVLTRKGNWLLEPKYDFVQRNNNSLSLLADRKIGTYFQADSLLFDPIYSSNIEMQGDYFKATLGNKVGLIDTVGEVIIPFEFQDSDDLNDSLYWLKTDTSWVIERAYDQQLFAYGIHSYSRIDYEDEFSYRILTSSGYGVLSSSGSQIIPSAFSDIKVIGKEDDIIYVCEQSVPEASYYIWVGYDQKGRRLFSEAYRDERYSEIACD